MTTDTLAQVQPGELLSHLKVIDLSTPLARDCARFLASMGAQVTKIELVLSELDRDGFLDLVRASDILIESFLPGTMAAAGLGYDDLAKINPRLIQVSITPFGQNGPYAEFKGRELTVSALSGALYQMGEKDGVPVREPGDANFFHAAGAGAAGALLAERMREKTGRGQLVDISAQEMGAGRGTVAIIKHQFNAPPSGRNGQRIDMGAGANRTLWPVSDGTVFYMEARPGTPGAADMDKWIEEATGSPPPSSHDHDTVEAFLASMTVEEAIAGARSRNIRLMSVSDAQGVMDDPQLAARNFFVEENGRKQPGPFLHFREESGE